MITIQEYITERTYDSYNKKYKTIRKNYMAIRQNI